MRWLLAGLLGCPAPPTPIPTPTPPTPPRCAGATLEGDLVVSEAPADLCPGTRWITGSLVVDGPIDGVACLCGIGGGLTLAEGAPEALVLPELGVVRGSLVLDGPITSVDLPLLAESGPVRVVAPALVVLALPALAEVDGSVVGSGNAALERVELPALATVGGVVDLRGNPSLRAVVVPAGPLDVPDAVLLSDTPLLAGLEGWSAATSVGGEIALRRSGARVVRGFGEARVIGGLSLVDLPRLTAIDAFGQVEEVAGSVWLGGLGPLEQGELLGQTRRIGGSLVIERFAGLRHLDLPALAELGGGLQIGANPLLQDLVSLEGVTHAGAVWISDNPQLSTVEGLHGLTEVAGELRIDGNGALLDLSGLRALTRVDGDLVISDNVLLGGVEGLASLAEVGGDVSISGNGLDPSVAEAFFEGVDVGGVVRITP